MPEYSETNICADFDSPIHHSEFVHTQSTEISEQVILKIQMTYDAVEIYAAGYC